MIFQETHLNDNVLDAEINIKEYTAYRSDRKTREGGGVIINIRSDFGVKSVARHTNSYCYSLGLFIPDLQLVLINVYRPPVCATEKFKENHGRNDNFH